MPEVVHLLGNLTVLCAVLYLVEELVQPLRVEELFQLPVEYFKLFSEAFTSEVAVPDSLDELLASLEVAWLSTSMELVLQPVLDI